MMNPLNWFRKTPKQPEGPRMAAPCGNDEEHYYWVDEGMFPCPLCRSDAQKAERAAQQREIEMAAAVKEERRRKRHEEMAHRVADIVIERLKKEQLL